MYNPCVLVLVALLLGYADSFSWDIVVGLSKGLAFYHNGTLTHTEKIPSAEYIVSLTYDPVHYRVLFADKTISKMEISSFNLTTRKIQRLVTTISSEYYLRIVFDPATQLLFWKDASYIYSYSLNRTINEVNYGKPLISLKHYCNDIALDSCGGYIYWITNYQIERARLDGSGREVLINSFVHERRSLAIDQNTQKLYWTEITQVNGVKQLSLESADFDGKNRATLYTERNASLASSLAVSKDSIYWQKNSLVSIWQSQKNQSQHVPIKEYSKAGSSCWYCHNIVANYTIEEQTQGVKNCDRLQRLIPYNSKSESTVLVSQTYCLNGNYSVTAEGKPKCSCKAGYSGERCELDACYQYCLNDGVCSLNMKSEPVCQCTEEYKGGRCEVPAFLMKCMQTVSLLKDMLNTDVTSATRELGLQSTCDSTVF